MSTHMLLEALGRILLTEAAAAQEAKILVSRFLKNASFGSANGGLSSLYNGSLMTE